MARAKRRANGVVPDERYHQVRHYGENYRAAINLSKEKRKEPIASITSPKVLFGWVSDGEVQEPGNPVNSAETRIHELDSRSQIVIVS